jgi:hypothetical protein
VFDGGGHRLQILIALFEGRLPVKCRSAVIKSAVFEPNWGHNFERVYDVSVGEVPQAPSHLLPESF